MSTRIPYYIFILVAFGLVACSPKRTIVDSDEYLTKEELNELQNEIDENLFNSQGNIQYNKLINFIHDLPEPKKRYYWNGRLKGYYNTIPELIHFRYSDNLLPDDKLKYSEWLKKNGS